MGSTESIKNFLHRFDGLAILSEKAIVHEIKQNRLKVIPIKGLKIKRTLRIAKRHGAESPISKLFIKELLLYNK